MSRSRSMPRRLAALLPAAAGLETDTALAGVDNGVPRPNIVVVITDDMRDSDWQALRKIRQRVADQGTVFPNFFLTTPVCSPSRTSILTGQYAHNHQVQRNSGPNGGYDQFRQRDLGAASINTALHAVGYRTGLFGKFMNGMPEKGPLPGSWDRWMATSELAYYRPQMNENGKAREFTKKKHYSTDILRNRATEFIRTSPAAQQLFMVFSAKAPHAPSTAARRDRGTFAGVGRLRSPDFNEADVSDKPDFIRRRGGLSAQAIAKFDREEQMRLDCLVATDDAVAAILDTLAATGRLDNTYVFVIGDNGWCAGSHRWETKDIPHNESTRIMMAVSGPRFAGGGVDTRVAANIDIAATIADLTGIGFGGDGVSLLEPPARDAVVLENWSIPFVALRTVRYLYVEYAWGDRELYDYELDPYELDNLLASWEGHTPTPAALAIAADLKDQLDALRSCAGSSCQ